MKDIRSKQYFTKMLLALLTLTAMLIVLLSIGLSMFFRYRMLRSEYESGMKSLAQISYGRDSMDIQASNLGRIMLTNRYVVAAMTSDRYNPLTSAAALNVINTATLSTRGVNSIGFYNAAQNTITSSLTGETVLLEHFYDTKLESMVRNLPDYQPQKPYFRTIENNGIPGRTAQVYTYIFPYRQGSTFQGVIIVNLNASLLSEMMASISDKGGWDGELLVFDEQNMVACSLQNESIWDATTLDRITSECRQRGEENGAFVVRVPGTGRYLVTYAKNGENDWLFTSMVPYANIIGQVRKTTFPVIGIVSLTMIGAMAFSVVIARRLYHPIEKLNDHISTNMFGQLAADETEAVNEIDRMSRVFDRVCLSATELATTTQQNRAKLRSHLLRRLLRGELSLQSREVKAFSSENNDLCASRAGGFLVLLSLKLTRRQETLKKYSEEEKLASFYGVTNVAEELLRAQYENAGAYMGEGRFCFLLRCSASQAEQFLFEATEIVEQIQVQLLKIYGFSISAALEKPFPVPENFAQAYEKLEDISQYTFLYPEACIVNETILEEVDNEYLVPTQHQMKTLMAALHETKYEKAQQLYQELSDKVALHSYQNMMDTYLFIAHTLYNECLTVEVHNNSFSTLMLPFIGELSQLETRSAVDEAFYTLLEQISACYKECSTRQSVDIVDQIRQFIDENYADSNLSLNSVAEHLNRSPAYIGRIYKEKTDQSVAEYILDVRMHRIQTLLEQTKLPLGSILEQVGMEKTNYFYTIFKKYFGVSVTAYPRGGASPDQKAEATR